jgi:ATP-binding cassette, subfamily B, bacterial PglK
MTASDHTGTLRKIREILNSHERRGVVFLFGLVTVGMFIEMLGIGLVLPLIMLLAHEDLGAAYPSLQPALEALGNPSQRALIIGGMLLLVAVYLVKSLYLAFLAWWQSRFIFGIRIRLSQKLFATYLRQPYIFHLNRNSAQLVRNTMSETGHFTQGSLQPALHLCSEGVLLFGIGVLLLVVEPAGTLVVAVILATAAWLFHAVTRKRVRQWGIDRKFHEGQRIQHLKQGLGGAKDVKLSGREADFLAQFKSHNRRAARAARHQSVLKQMPRLWLEFLAVLGLVTLVLVMVYQERNLANILPTLGLFAAAALRMMPSVNKLVVAIQTLRFHQPALDTIREELKLYVPGPRAASPAAASPPALEREVCVEHVTFTYPGGARPAVDDIFLAIKKGETVGFIGPSGSGKSTLIDIILGLLEPDSGRILVDGNDIRQDPRAWQDQIGYVPQSIYLTDDSLRRNVAFGIPSEEIDDEAVMQAIRGAQLEEFVGSLAEGLECVVGERGVRLSGGQRQRIGIARALYHNPGVLVLDEATSSLDTATEQGVMEAVKALHGSKTILIVAHRLSTVRDCDRLFRLHEGRIVDEGAPAVILDHSPQAFEAHGVSRKVN